jgi:hypothetical protein
MMLGADGHRNPMTSSQVEARRRVVHRNGPPVVETENARTELQNA